MTLDIAEQDGDGANWLFAIGAEHNVPAIDGLVAVSGFNREHFSPEQVAVLEKAEGYKARAVFFEAERHGRAPVAQALIFDALDHSDDGAFAELHKRLWSWGGVPLVYRAAPGLVQLFRCAHEPDFQGSGELPVCRPIRFLQLGADIAEADLRAAWWDANRIRNGSIWDDPDTCRLMLSAKDSAHRKLVEAVRALADQLNERNLLEPGLRRRLLILSLLIAYLEERSVLLEDDFACAMPHAKRFFQVLANGPALISLLEALEDRFNGHVFRLKPEERAALENSTELESYARLVEGYEDESGQIALWRLYSFRDLPVELISNIYQLFVKDASTSIYTPPALVRLILEETLSWVRLNQLMSGDGVILDPACGSGVFLVEGYRRLVLHWRSRNGWKQPDVETLRLLLQRVHGIDLEDGAVELAAFSLCLSLCDALEPEDIRASVKLFPPLADITLHGSCFFDAKERGVVRAPVAVIVGNPPFESALTTEGARKSYAAYVQAHGNLADKQLAYLFIHEAMEMLAPGGVLAMVEPSGFLYNQNALAVRQSFLARWRVREILDFVSVRGLFKKGDADPKIIVVIAEADKAGPDDKLLHAVFRRNGRATAEQGFDIDYYDLYWVRNADAATARDVWRANLLGGSRARSLIERLRGLPTLYDFATAHGWDFGEGYIAGAKGISRPADHIVGKNLLPTSCLSENGLETQFLDVAPNRPIKDPKTARRFTPPYLLIKEHEDLHNGLWDGQYMVYKDKIVGLVAPKHEFDRLVAVKAWLGKEHIVLRAYVAGISASSFTQRATAILSADIFALPYGDGADLDLSRNERIVAEDIVDYQRDFIRLGTSAPVMRHVPAQALKAFDEILESQINSVYPRKPLKALDDKSWPGAICRVYVFGEGEVDWTNASELRNRLDRLLRERCGESLTVSRIIRLYDHNFVFLLKPDRHRFWTRSIALRDADDILADLRAQGF
jgi:hypothetical protein